MTIPIRTAIEEEGRRAAAHPPSPRVADALTRVVALAAEEAFATGTPIGHRLGLGRADLAAILRQLPHLAAVVGPLDGAPDPVVEDDEDQVRLLLLLARAEETDDSRRLAFVMARRAMEPDHLWQDMGLASRADLSALIAEVFPVLHERNTRGMRWKKFFYRELCEREGFVLCAAPSCSACTDYDSCFGAEDGPSRLAAIRRAAH